LAATADREALERRIRTFAEAGDKERAAIELLRGYGNDILRFLMARLRDPDAASEVFSQFTENLWKGIGGFRWQSSARVWVYTLASHAASRYIHDARRRRAHHVPLSDAGPLSAIGNKIRTATLAEARTESRDGIARLRDALPPDDQTLLVLRVDRRLDWKEIAHVMAGEALADAQRDKEAARLRKRYQHLKDKLRQMAEEQGLLSTTRPR
jgi:RNA polymerase sigma-70 factor (ECF subfamily)